MKSTRHLWGGVLFLCWATLGGCNSNDYSTTPAAHKSIAEEASSYADPAYHESTKQPLHQMTGRCWSPDDSSLISIRGKVLFWVCEAWREPGEYVLHMYTDYNLSCANFWLTNDFDASGRRFRVCLRGIELQPPSVCLTASGPATAQMELPILADGRYPLHINYRRQHDRYTVIVKDGEVSIRSHRSTFTAPVACWSVAGQAVLD